MIKDLAAKYDVTTTQIILGWGLARGVSLATQSRNELHRKQTLNVGFPATMPHFVVLLKSSPIASRVGPGRCGEDHVSGSQPVCLLPARRIWNYLGMDSGAVWVGTPEDV